MKCALCKDDYPVREITDSRFICKPCDKMLRASNRSSNKSYNIKTNYGSNNGITEKSTSKMRNSKLTIVPLKRK